MAHTHDVYDTGKCFEINGLSRFIKETSDTKLVLVQGDHKSEAVTFKLPRYIDGHDMLLCNKIRVHYINIDTKTGDSSSDIYEVTDLALCEDCEEETLMFTWTVEAPATKYAGTLAFLIKFECTEGANVLYQWNTAKYVGTNVLAGLDNSEYFVEKYSNVLEEWYNKLTNGADSIEEMIEQSVDEALKRFPKDYRELSKNVDELLETVKDLSSAMDMSNLTMTITAIENANRLTLSDGTVEKYVDIPALSIPDEQLADIVNAWIAENGGIQAGATTKQVKQINQNTQDIVVERARIDNLLSSVAETTELKELVVDVSGLNNFTSPSTITFVSNGHHVWAEAELTVKGLQRGGTEESGDGIEVPADLKMFMPFFSVDVTESTDSCTVSISINGSDGGEIVGETFDTFIEVTNNKSALNSEVWFRFDYPLVEATAIDNLEIKDARIDINGVEHDTLGGAIRNQIAQAMQNGGSGVITDAQIEKAISDYLEKHPITGASPVRIGYVDLLAKNWVGDSEKYSQVVSIKGVTAKTEVELKISAEQVTAFNQKNVAFLAENIGGVVTVYAFGQKPMNDYTLQVKLTEVEEV